MTSAAAFVAQHPSERPRVALAPIARASAIALAAASVVFAAGLAVRLALGLLAPAPAMPLGQPGVAPGTIVVQAAAATMLREPVMPALASPAAGTTGTAELPPVPASVPVASIGDAGITPARAFSLAGVSALDRARAVECLTAAIYYEAASEPDDGQRAVAQVVLNRVRHHVFPSTVCGVVYQGSERRGCQFSFACDGSMARVPSRSGWARAARNAAAALNGLVFAPVGLATHYHTYAVTPAWNRTLVMTDAIGAHFFHRWKGYWGTTAAFTQAYRGGEPVPGPHTLIVAPVMALTAAVPAAGALPAVPVTPAADVQPAHRASGEALVAPARRDDALPESQVLDRWRDSGKPLF